MEDLLDERGRRFALTFLLGLVLALPCATLVAQGANDAVISGLILNSVTGRPIVRAGVMARLIGKDQLSASAPAFSDGRFSITLPAGLYRLEVSAAGFQQVIVATMTLAPGDRRHDVRIRMTPLCGIAGVVVGSDGERVRGALVELMEPARDGIGLRRSRSVRSATSDDRGEYRMPGIPAGRYLIKASADARRDGLAYLSVFHPGVAAPGEARAVAIEPGTSDAQIDFLLPVVKPVKLRLRVTGEGEQWAQFTAVSADAMLSRPQPLLLNRIAAGDYATTLVPGVWRITVRNRADGRAYRDVQTVAVQGDEQEIVFTPRAGIELDGVLVVEGGTVTPQRPIAVSLEAADDIPNDDARILGHPAGDGRYRLRDVPAGEWGLSVADLPDNAYLKSVQLAGRDIPGAVLSVNADTRGPLRVVVSMRGGRVHGQVSGAVGGVAVLIPRANPIVRCRTALVDSKGRFQLASLAPGEYIAYATQSPRSDACVDPADSVAPIQPVTVHVQEGANVEVTLPGAP